MLDKVQHYTLIYTACQHSITGWELTTVQLKHSIKLCLSSFSWDQLLLWLLTCKVYTAKISQYMLHYISILRHNWLRQTSTTNKTITIQRSLRMLLCKWWNHMIGTMRLFLSISTHMIISVKQQSLRLFLHKIFWVIFNQNPSNKSYSWNRILLPLPPIMKYNLLFFYSILSMSKTLQQTSHIIYWSINFFVSNRWQTLHFSKVSVIFWGKEGATSWSIFLNIGSTERSKAYKKHGISSSKTSPMSPAYWVLTLHHVCCEWCPA